MVRSYFSGGFEEGSNDYLETKDHLGSIREVAAANGTSVESTSEYRSWGLINQTSGARSASHFSFTGHSLVLGLCIGSKHYSICRSLLQTKKSYVVKTVPW